MEAELLSRDQVGWQRSLPQDQIKGTETHAGERPGDGSAGGQRPRGAPLGLGFLDSAFGETELAADFSMA